MAYALKGGLRPERMAYIPDYQMAPLKMGPGRLGQRHPQGVSSNDILKGPVQEPSHTACPPALLLSLASHCISVHIHSFTEYRQKYAAGVLIIPTPE